MARYWVGGTGTWDASTTTNWSATSGGAGGASAPTSADDVIFDANSDAGGIFTVTIGTGAVCRDITAGSLDFTMTMAGSAAWSIYGSLTFPATNLTRTYTGAITFAATTTGNTITTNGVSFVSSITFNGVGGEWALGSAILTTNSYTLTNGTFLTNGFNVTANSFLSFGNSIRSANFSTSSLLFTGSGPINISATNFTFNAGTSTIECNSVSPTFSGGGLTYYNVSFTSTASGTHIIIGANTFNNLTFASLAVTGIRNISIGANQTVNGTLTLGTANTAIRRLFMRSDTIGTARTITAAAIATLADVDFRDIVAAGASGTWSGTRLGNCLGNSNITFDASKSVYRIGTGNWSATQWALSSGGAVDVNNFPLAQDDCIFDTNTTTGTHTVDAGWNIGGIDFSALTVSVTWATGTTTPSIYRNLTLDSDVTVSGTGVLTFANRSTQTITSAGKTFTQPITVNSPSGIVQLQDNAIVDAARTVTLTAGTLDLNDFNLTEGLFSSTGTLARQLDVGTGTITNSGATFTVSGSNFTTAGTGTISMTSASSKTFAGGGFSYPALNQGGAGALNVTGANTFADITNTVQPCTVIFPANTITNVYDFNLSGTAGNLVTIQSSIAGQRFTLNKVEP